MFCHKATDREFVWRVKLGEEEMKITAREKEKRGVSQQNSRASQHLRYIPLLQTYHLQSNL